MGFKLKPHQKEAVERIKKSYQLILADEMGLGKTATILKATRDTWVGYAGKGKLVLIIIGTNHLAMCNVKYLQDKLK